MTDRRNRERGTQMRDRSAPKMRRLAWLRVRRLAVKELRQLLRDPKTKRVIFVAPVLQLILFGYAVDTDVRDMPMAVVDEDRSGSSRSFIDAFTAGGYFDVVLTSDRPGDLGQALDRGRATVALHVPPGFAEDLAAGRGPTVQLLVDGTNSNTATVAQGYAVRIARAWGASHAAGRGGSAGPGVTEGGTTAAGTRGPAAALEPGGSASFPVRLPEGIDLRARAWFNPSLESRVYNVPAVIGVIVLLMCLLLTAMAVVREREIGTLEQLLVSPLSASELILGKTIPVAGIAMIQLTLVTAVALLWFDVPLRGSVALLLLAAMLFILAGLSLGLLVSTFSATQQEAFLAMFLFLLPAIILSGFLYPVDTMPEVFQQLTLVNPLRHFLEIVRGIFLKGAGVGDLWPQLLVLTGMAGAGLFVATMRFRRTL